MITDSDSIITPEMAEAMNQLATDVFDIFSEVIPLPTVNTIPERLGDLLYFEDVKDFEQNLKELENVATMPPEWITPKEWTVQIGEFAYRHDTTFDYIDWNRWYIDLNILLNLSIEDLPEQWNEINVNRYKSVWNGNASLEWEE